MARRSEQILHCTERTHAHAPCFRQQQIKHQGERKKQAATDAGERERLSPGAEEAAENRQRIEP
jgi:hypothetical protein